MCGIAGIAAFNGSVSPTMERLKDMCDTLIHRGPDEEGMEIRDNIAIGMRRLSIIDLAGGSQPIFNEDKTIRVVFNGEIYNFRELRKNLEASGHVFRTNTDTEVIVHAYEEFGDDFPKQLNGMFAFALHDLARRKLVLARDHIGIKPLFYAFSSDSLVWGSEIKAILASKRVARDLDFDALAEFLTWEYIPGERTLFKAIRKLEPGKMIEIDLDQPSLKIREFWDIPDAINKQHKSAQEWEDAVDAKLKECIQRQLVSDVPLGAFLSGGVDSSLVVAAMGDAETFSIGFDDPTYNELQWARKVAKHLGVDHKDEIIKPDIAELFQHLMYFMDDPIGDFSIFPTYLVSHYARKQVKVSLSGDGGDELFGGYETYLANGIAAKYNHVPRFLGRNIIEPFVRTLKPRPKKKGLINKAIRFVEGMAYPSELSHARWRIFMGDEVRNLLFTPAALEQMRLPPAIHITDLFQRAGNRGPINRSLYVDVKSYLVDNCLVKLDRMSMAVSLESRVPLLDKEMVELAFQVPEEQKIAAGQTKVLLKRIAARYIPKDCVYRPKEGFSIPIKNWLLTDLKPMMEELLSPDVINRQGIFNAACVEKLKQEHLKKRANHSHIIWSLMVFQAWCKLWLEG